MNADRSKLANALSQNCGAKMNRELASRSFTDAMLRLANDRNTHQAVKAKILERMAEWTEMFAADPDLGIMEQQYMKLKQMSTLPAVALSISVCADRNSRSQLTLAVETCQISDDRS
jgi:VHS domain